jgi:predicted nucleotidyltransferase
MVIDDASVEAGIRQVLHERKDALAGYRVLLFGSRARGSPRAASDFDLAIDGDKPLELNTFYEIEDALERLPTLARIDWIDLNRASKRLRDSARSEGKLFYEG